MHLRRTLAALALLSAAAPGEQPNSRQAPAYAAAGLVNLASGEPFSIAPNTLVALLGRDLAFTTRPRLDSDAAAGILPVSLPGTGVTVTVNGLLSAVEYVSPEVVTFVVPAEFAPGPATITLTRQGAAGPSVRLELLPFAPTLFESGTGWVLARHASSLALVTAADPARPAETVILYATGLGPTSPPQLSRKAPRAPAALADPSLFRLLLDGVPPPPGRLGYVGIADGLPGVYEIHLQVPDLVDDDPKVAIFVGESGPAPAPRLPLRNRMPVSCVQ
jgi:uncharacterized protein (TIGR03437 family)